MGNLFNEFDIMFTVPGFIEMKLLIQFLLLQERKQVNAPAQKRFAITVLDRWQVSDWQSTMSLVKLENTRANLIQP